MTFGIDKQCPRCGETKPASEFYRQTSGHYSSYCRPCSNAYSRAYISKKYREDPEFREATKARARQWEIDNKQRKNERQRCNYDPAKQQEARKRFASANPGVHADHHRNSRYKITRDLFDALIEKQEGCCAICREPFTKTPRIDHDHGSGTVRGLLCDGCNRGLGYFRDKPEYLRAAADYAERFQIVT